MHKDWPLTKITIGMTLWQKWQTYACIHHFFHSSPIIQAYYIHSITETTSKASTSTDTTHANYVSHQCDSLIAMYGIPPPQCPPDVLGFGTYKLHKRPWLELWLLNMNVNNNNKNSRVKGKQQRSSSHLSEQTGIGPLLKLVSRLRDACIYGVFFRSLHY